MPLELPEENRQRICCVVGRVRDSARWSIHTPIRA